MAESLQHAGQMLSVIGLSPAVSWSLIGLGAVLAAMWSLVIWAACAADRRTGGDDS